LIKGKLPKTEVDSIYTFEMFEKAFKMNDHNDLGYLNIKYIPIFMKDLEVAFLIEVINRLKSEDMDML
jgi:hypothetical protein